MKYLGIDYGSKRVGVAVSDENGAIAFPREVFPNDKKLVEKIKSVCVDEKIEKIVIGESKNFSGDDNPIMTDIKSFAEIVKTETNLPVIFEAEFMTSIQASRIQGEVEGLDASAAALILQSYLDKIKNKELRIKNNEEVKIKYEDFSKVEMKVGKILLAEKIPDTDKLLKLNVDFGEEKTRQIVSGISLYFSDPNILIGKNCLFVTNLEPRVIRGHESNGMILALSTEDGAFSLLEPNKDIPIGTKVK